MSAPTRSGRWICHPADRINVARAFVAPLLLFAPYFIQFPDGTVWLYAILIFMFIGKTNYLLHLHIHHPFAGSWLLNDLLDLSMGMVTAMVSSNWRIQHLYGHHQGIDLPYRGHRTWHLEKYSPARAVGYSMISIWGTFYGPFLVSFRKGVLANVTSPLSYRWAFCEHTLLVLFVAMLLAWQPWLTFTYLLPWYLATHFVTRYVDYLNHYGCNEKSADPFEHANNSLNRLFNLTTHNFGYHTAHHIRPGAHWTELPAIHQTIADRIPPRRIKSFSWSGLLMPYHFYLSRSGKA